MMKRANSTKAVIPMGSSSNESVLGPSFFESTPALPLHRRLYDTVRAAILGGQLRPGDRIAATRRLAAELGVSRTTVLAAVEQLVAEGYLEAKTGSGTFVSSVLPDDLLLAHPTRRSAPEGAVVGPDLSERGAIIARTSVAVARDAGALRPFRTGVPALDHFPFDVWTALTDRRLRDRDPEVLLYADPGGYTSLREAIVSHLAASRAVHCLPEQVIVVSGSQQGIQLVAELLLDPGDVAWMEDPGYMGAKGALQAAGVRVAPVALDDEGLDVQTALAAIAKPRLIYVTPSHQYPSGVIMSLSRRIALLRYGGRIGAWIVEDDYDSEYRYRGHPLAALQGLDTENRVIYIGTFSKVLFPGLRMGYLVVPSHLVDAFRSASSLADRGVAGLPQAVIADFMNEGHFARHVRRMRLLYAQRQAFLVDAVKRHLFGLLEVPPQECGMHLVGRLPPNCDDNVVARLAHEMGVEVTPLSAFAERDTSIRGLMLGFAPFDESAMEAAVVRLKVAILRVHSSV